MSFRPRLDLPGAARRHRSSGLDFSPAAIAEARALAADTRIDARFVEGNVYDARALLEGEFDMVYVTWGAINWLPDIAAMGAKSSRRCSSRAAGSISPKVIRPFCASTGWTGASCRASTGARRTTRRFADEVPTTYTGAPDLLENKRVYEWIHPLSDIFHGLITAGLRLERFTEHAALTWPLFPNMTVSEDGLYRLPPDHPQLPLSFSLDATRGR